MTSMKNINLALTLLLSTLTAGACATTDASPDPDPDTELDQTELAPRAPDAELDQATLAPPPQTPGMTYVDLVYVTHNVSGNSAMHAFAGYVPDVQFTRYYVVAAGHSLSDPSTNGTQGSAIKWIENNELGGGGFLSAVPMSPPPFHTDVNLVVIGD